MESRKLIQPAATAPPDKPRLLVFYSDTSGQCRKVDAYLAQVLQRHRNHNAFEVIRLRVDDQPEAVALLAIETLPTLVVVQRGAVQARVDGPRGRAEIATALAPWLRTATGQQIRMPEAAPDDGDHASAEKYLQTHDTRP